MRVNNPANLLSRVISTAACAFLLCAALAAQTSTVLHQFRATNSRDGSESYAGLIAGPHGRLYGDSFLGGSANNGIIFELSPPASSGGAWVYRVLYSFGATPDGAGPRGTLTRDHDGNLYGTTQIGGQSGCGTVFELSPPAISGGAWTESVLYSFKCSSTDGSGPLGGVVFDELGNLYGSTEGGGVQGLGTVFKLTPSTSGGTWTEAQLHSFRGDAHDGDEPFYGLTFAGHGTFYGFTSYGGASGSGTFYQITTRGKETVLYTFQDGLDGGAPTGEPILDASGNVYGTANVGGATNNGVVFEFTLPVVTGQPWTETVLYSFSGSDGSSPSGVTFGPSGVLYGTTWVGGTNNDGVVFELAAPTSGGSWTESTLLELDGKGDGASVWAAPALFNGTLYGVAIGGGTEGAGTVFAVTP